MRAHEILPKITLAKIEKTGQVVQLVKHADQVGFSDEQGWFLINTNPGADTGPSTTVKWIPDSTRFAWVKKFSNLGEALANTHQQIIEYSLFDLHHEFFEEISQLDISLFENKEDYLKLKSILNDFSTPAPTIGKKYVYASVASTPAGKLINVAHFAQPHQLVNIKNGRYYFNINGSQRVFPEQGSVDKQDSYQHIFMFTTPQDFKKMFSWVTMNCSESNGWKVGSKLLDQTYVDENFADKKVKGKSRPGRVKRAGASCAGSVTSLRAKAKKYGGERGQMYHWCANMKAGKKKAVTESVDAEDVLDYVKRKHGSDFDIEHAITDHPNWHLTLVPIRKLKLDPEGEYQDPYGRVNWVDDDTVNDLLPNIQNIVRSSPIVVDSNGWIIDGNHRATAAHLAGLNQIPAYIPTK